MTDPSSYLFYDSQNAKQERNVGTRLSRVFISEGRMTIYDKEIIRTAKSGVLFEKINKQTTYSLNHNSDGVPYLKRSNKSVSGSFTDTSMYVIGGDQRFHETYMSHAQRELVESTILGWFGHQYQDGLYNSIKFKLMFPALSDPAFPNHTTLETPFITLQGMGYGIAKALREAHSWNSFLFALCPTVNSFADSKMVEENIGNLLPIAVMQLGQSLSDFSEEEQECLLVLNRRLNMADTKIVDFMLTNSSPEGRQSLLDTLFKLVRLHSKRLDDKNSKFLWVSLDRTRSKLNLNRVPSSRRDDLSRVLRASLESALVEYEAFVPSRLDHVDVAMETKLYPVLRDWFAINVTEPQMTTQLTPELVEERFRELFGVSLWEKTNRNSICGIPFRGQDGAIAVHSKNNVFFCSITERFNRAGRISEFNENLFVSLDQTVKTKRPSAKGLLANSSSSNGYVTNNGEFVPVDGQIYSLDDILAIIERGVELTDAQLIKLGRKITPANRVAFLTLATRERRFKNTWKLYDWGVHDPKRIEIMKKYGINRKEQVETYNLLPDDMFIELIALESGEEYHPEDDSIYNFLLGKKMKYA